MKSKLLISVLLIIEGFNLQAQDLKEYIRENAQSTNIEEFNIDFGNSDLQNSNLVFFGFVHGSSTPQVVDFELLKYLVEEGDFRHYAPEIDLSQAFFLNKYLETGDVQFLDFVIFFYGKRIPQDASIQLREKWVKINQLNQRLPEKNKLKVIGTDIPSTDKRLAVTHLAHLLKEIETGNPQLDSLKLHQTVKLDDRKIWSGAPAIPKIQQYGGYTYDYVYPIDSKFNFVNRFCKYYDKNREDVIKELGKYNINISRILDKKSKHREDDIFESFQEQIIPLIKSGKKVYSNFGFAHVHQKEIYGNCYLACKIKNQYPELKVNSILGLLAKSTVLKERKWKKGNETITERRLVFNKMIYSGYKTSKTWDGHGLFEQLDGINKLIKINKSNDISFLDLNKANSPFEEKPYLVSYRIGGKDVNVDLSGNTLEYFQYAILMKKSKANIPTQPLSD